MKTKYAKKAHSKYSHFACRGKHKEWQKQHEEIKRLECSKRYVAASYERNGMYRFHMVGVST